jgi:hypothetical protein
MPRIQILLKGDHVLTSPALNDDEAAQQLDDVQQSFSLNDPLVLPWARVLPRAVVSAHKLEDD